MIFLSLFSFFFYSGPIFGKYMHKLGVRKVYFFGILVTAFCAMAFGVLDFVMNKATFLALSYTLRIFEGIAEAASWSAVSYFAVLPINEFFLKKRAKVGDTDIHGLSQSLLKALYRSLPCCFKCSPKTWPQFIRLRKAVFHLPK